MKSHRIIILAATLLAALLVSTASTAPVTTTMSYQGFLTDDMGDPLSGSFDITFSLYGDAAGTNLLWTESHPGVVVEGGVFNAILGGAGTPLDPADFSQPLWLGVTVSPDPQMPLIALTSTAYSLGGHNTLDAAYDEGGAGVGRTVATDAGAVHLTGSGGLLADASVEAAQIVTSEVVLGSAMPISTEQMTSSTSFSVLTTFSTPSQSTSQLASVMLRLHARGASAGETAVFRVRGFCFGTGSETDVADFDGSAPLMGVIHIRNATYQDYFLNLGTFALSAGQRWRFIVEWRARNGGSPSFIDELEWELRSLEHVF